MIPIKQIPKNRIKVWDPCGIYFLFDKGEIVYVGSSHSCHQRIRTHIRQGKMTFDAYQVFTQTVGNNKLAGFKKIHV